MKQLLAKINNTERPVYQLIKYGMVGVLNTLVTLIVIVLCKSFIGINEYVSNMIGYVMGVLNSFLWNRSWVFHSHGQMHRDMIYFLGGCLICYLVQFAVLYILTNWVFEDIEYDLGFFVVSGYGIATLIAMVVYTLCNFIYNRTITFRRVKIKKC